MQHRHAFAFLLAATIAAASPASGDVSLSVLGTYAGGGAEIGAFDSHTDRFFVTNSPEQAVDVLDLSDPTNPTLLFQIDVSGIGGGEATSVAVKRGLLAVAIPGTTRQSPGSVAIYRSALSSSGSPIAVVPVGALPDMVTFDTWGIHILVANEGEPSSYCEDGIDPEGSISVIRLPVRLRHAGQIRVRTADFRRFNDRVDQLRDAGVRIFGPGATVAQDLEPEYITMKDPFTAWVSLQENNAIAEVDVFRARVRRIIPLGTKDHNAPGNGIDASDRDDAINIQNWPVHGMYQPDSIASFRTYGRSFVITANEGDAREYDCLIGDVTEEDERIKDLDLDPVAFPDAATLQEDENLGRLGVSLFEGDPDGDGDYDALFSLGGRSFSIWSSRGNLVFDSGDDFEQITALAVPDNFNADNDEPDFDARSDAKGPEPEGVAVGRIGHRTYAFIGLERVGGVMTYDVTNPWDPTFEDYINNRDFAGGGDLAPEGLVFIRRLQSPTRQPLLVVTNEESATTTVYSVNVTD